MPRSPAAPVLAASPVFVRAALVPGVVVAAVAVEILVVALAAVLLCYSCPQLWAPA